ncbi:MAG TPA: hypothetical protein VFZ70_06505 [Euzebyales bacterium]
MVAILAAWAVVAVLATLFFALGGSLGYRRGVKDTLTQIRERRTGKKGCRPMPANHLRRRTSGHARPGAKARRARWYPGPVEPAQVAPVRSRRTDPRITVAVSMVAVLLLIGVPGTAVGATTAQPGEPLWRLKLGLERVRVTLASGGAQDADVHTDLASVRLGELHGLVVQDLPVDVVAEVSGLLHAHVTAAATALDEVADSEHRMALQRRLELVADRQVDVMDALAATSGCTGNVGAATDGCAELEQVRDSTVALRRTTDAAVALAEDDGAPPQVVAQVDRADAIDSASDAGPDSAASPTAAIAAADQPRPAVADDALGDAERDGSAGSAESRLSAQDSAARDAGSGVRGVANEPRPTPSASSAPSVDGPATAAPPPTPTDEETPPATPTAADADDASEAPEDGGAPPPDPSAPSAGDSVDIAEPAGTVEP